MNIEDSKARLQLLFDYLKKEIDGDILPSGVWLKPDAGSFYIKAKKLVDEAVIYSKLDSSFDMNAVLHTFRKEVEFVRDYTGKSKTPKKRQQELEKLINKATHQLYIDLCGIIK